MYTGWKVLSKCILPCFSKTACDIVYCIALHVICMIIYILNVIFMIISIVNVIFMIIYIVNVIFMIIYIVNVMMFGYRVTWRLPHLPLANAPTAHHCHHHRRRDHHHHRHHHHHCHYVNSDDWWINGRCWGLSILGSLNIYWTSHALLLRKAIFKQYSSNFDINCIKIIFISGSINIHPISI